jgi:hypothetical protein
MVGININPMRKSLHKLLQPCLARHQLNSTSIVYPITGFPHVAIVRIVLCEFTLQKPLHEHCCLFLSRQIGISVNVTEDEFELGRFRLTRGRFEKNSMADGVVELFGEVVGGALDSAKVNVEVFFGFLFVGSDALMAEIIGC